MPRSRLLPMVLVLALASSSGCARVLYNFGRIEQDRIYRSAQPSPLFLRWLTAHHGIRSLVNLRGSTPGYESAFAARNGLRLYSFSLSAGRPPSAAEVRRFLDIVQDPENHPVLVHCRRGVDRTGYMLGIYRVEVLDWDTDRAAREMNRYLQFEWPNAVPQEILRGRRADSD